MKTFTHLLRWTLSLTVFLGLAVGGWLTRERWLPWIVRTRAVAPFSSDQHAVEPKLPKLKLSKQAQENLKLKLEAVEPSTYWRTIQMPGNIIERAGQSSRSVTTTIPGIIYQVHILPGQLVKPGEALFAIRLVSEYVQSVQAQLYKAARDLQINQEEQKRYKAVEDSQALFQKRLIEFNYEERRLQVALDTHRQDLLSRGFSEASIKQVIAGKFLTEFTIHASEANRNQVYEVEELKVSPGEMVQAGQALAVMGSHQALEVEGKAFEQESPQLQQAARQNWPVQLTLMDQTDVWQTPPPPLHLRYISSHVDPTTRLLSFFLPLENQVRELPTAQGASRRVWRYRPGQRVRLSVPLERHDDVFILPREAVVHEGPDAYVFRQNGSLLERRAVYVRFEDDVSSVLANDGSITRGNVIAMNAAVALNRAVKSQLSSATSDAHTGHSH